MSIPRVYAYTNSKASRHFVLNLASHPSQSLIPQIILLFNKNDELKRFLDLNSCLSIPRYNLSRQFMAINGVPQHNKQPSKITNLLLSDNSNATLFNMAQKLTHNVYNDTNLLLFDINPNNILGLRRLYPQVSDKNLIRIRTSMNKFNSTSRLSIESTELPRELEWVKECCNVTEMDVPTFERRELERMITNSSVFSILNTVGELKNNKYVNELLDQIIKEQVNVVRSIWKIHFDENRLIRIALERHKHPKEQLHLTKAEYFQWNLWINRNAKMNKIPCFNNKLLEKMINAKTGGLYLYPQLPEI